SGGCKISDHRGRCGANLKHCARDAGEKADLRFYQHTETPAPAGDGVCFDVARCRSPWVRRTPGVPRPLGLFEEASADMTRMQMHRENAEGCLDSATLRRQPPHHKQTEHDMSKLRLNFACGPYDRTLALRDGTVQVEGVELNYLNMQPAEIFWRQLQFQEFDASEMSLSNYTSLVSTGKSPFIAIPVFPSRVFRHGYFFVNTSKGIKSGADLKGKRGGVPEYSMTAAVYMRGLMQHEFGVKPNEVEWVQGRHDRLGRKLPADIRMTQAPAGTELGDLLDRGEIDFMM